MTDPALIIYRGRPGFEFSQSLPQGMLPEGVSPEFSADTYATPGYLMRLDEIAAGRQSDANHWNFSFDGPRTVVTVAQLPSFSLPYRIYVLDENFEIMAIESTEDLFHEIARQQNFFCPSKPNSFRLLESPIIYREEGEEEDGQKESRVLIFQAKGVLRSSEPDAGSLARLPFEAAQRQLERTYIENRYGTAKPLEGPEEPFSAVAASRAWHRIHPQMRQDAIGFAPVLESPVLAQMLGALQVVVVDETAHPDIFMGQATSAMNALAQFPALAREPLVAVYAAGGGGLLAGGATYIKLLHPNARVVGVNSDRVPVLKKSLAKGYLDLRDSEINAPEKPNYADGTDVPNFGPGNFEQIKKIGGEGEVVTQDEIAEVLVFADSQPWLHGQSKRLEGAATLPIAALLNGAVKNVANHRVMITLSGKNVDEATMVRAYQEKGWVRDNPEFYKFVCDIRKTLRARYEDQGATERVHAFNRLLATESGFEELMNLFDGYRESRDGAISLVLSEVEHEWENYVFIPSEKVEAMLPPLWSYLEELERDGKITNEDRAPLQAILSSEESQVLVLTWDQFDQLRTCVDQLIKQAGLQYVAHYTPLHGFSIYLTERFLGQNISGDPHTNWTAPRQLESWRQKLRWGLQSLVFVFQ